MPEKRGLILSRRVGESIVISKDIVVTVMRIEKGQIRLGIEAPREVPVHRTERPEAKQLSKLDNWKMITTLPYWTS